MQTFLQVSEVQIFNRELLLIVIAVWGSLQTNYPYNSLAIAQMSRSCLPPDMADMNLEPSVVTIVSMDNLWVLFRGRGIVSQPGMAVTEREINLEPSVVAIVICGCCSEPEALVNQVQQPLSMKLNFLTGTN